MNDLQTIEEGNFSVQSVKIQMDAVKDLYQSVMVKDEHYGMIPGTKKETLYKAGAEKLITMFQLVPKVDENTEKDLGGGHREIIMTIGLYSKKTGNLWGQGVGSCSTMESKFRYRNAEKVCPVCGQTTIIKGKDEFGGGWICYKKKGGCGEKFADDAVSIVDQVSGKVENPDIADVYNTVLKMAYKRALVSATISATGISDIFTQDVEDFAHDITPPKQEPAKQEPAKSKKEVSEDELIQKAKNIKDLKTLNESQKWVEENASKLKDTTIDQLVKVFDDKRFEFENLAKPFDESGIPFPEGKK